MQNKKKGFKIAMRIVVVLLALVIVVGIILACYYLIKPSYGEMEIYTVGDTKTLVVGVLSDSQLPPKKPKNGVNEGKEKVKKSLELLKEQGVEVVVFAGDLGDLASSYAYDTYNEAFNEVFAEEKPEVVNIMGNHDNWFSADYVSVAPKERIYKKCMGESPWVHKVINGFHFIGASPDKTSNTNGYTKKTLAWIDEQIALAEESTPDGYPIFVITHHAPKDTMYGSSDWNDPDLDGVLSKYENVVSISGHSHYSLVDERSIDQKNYTAFQTQSVAYIEQETGKYDAFQDKIATIPPKAGDFPYEIVMRVGTDKTTIERWNIYDKAEEKADRRWTLDYPLEKGNFAYEFTSRKHATTPPVFEEITITYDNAVKSLDNPEKTLPGISFASATDDDVVQSYEVNLKKSTGEEYSYLVFSDYYMGLANMQKEVKIPLDKKLKAGTYDVKVYAIDSFGHYSENCAKGTIELKR